MTKKKDTVGKVSLDLIEKASEADHSAEEQMREQLADYESNVEAAYYDGKKKYAGDFYIVVLTKKERLMQNVLRNYFFVRKSCPTPEWDQVVYHYDNKHDTLQLLWVIPAKDVCKQLLGQPEMVPPEEYELLSFVQSFDDGTLLEKARLLNGEYTEIKAKS